MSIKHILIGESFFMNFGYLSGYTVKVTDIYVKQDSRTGDYNTILKLKPTLGTESLNTCELYLADFLNSVEHDPNPV